MAVSLPISNDQIMSLLNSLYEQAIEGIPGSSSCTELAEEYLNKYKNVEIAAKKMTRNQILKCATSGFLTGIGGLLTLPVAIPANLASVLYIQLRMIAAIAVMGGYDVQDDEVQTFVYLCLLGDSITGALKKAGIEVANKAALKTVMQKIPGAALVAINRQVGFRLITKAGTKGVINISKLVPVAGGLVGAGIDGAMTNTISKVACKTFLRDTID